MACTCSAVAMGSYANQETRYLPFATERYPEPGTKPVGIDRCILPDVEALWAAGIETIESCCGHGTAPGYIAVRERHIGAMVDTGWQFVDWCTSRGVFAWPLPSHKAAETGE